MMSPNVVQVLPTKDYTVYVFFENGVIKEYSLKKTITKGGVFEKLVDIDFFINSCTVMNRTLAWDLSGRRDPTDCIDICPDVIYEDGKTVKQEDIIV